MFKLNDIHPNRGPIQYPCGICGRSVNSNHRAMSCDNCEHWVHIKCGNISPVEYNNMCKCDNIIYYNLCKFLTLSIHFIGQAAFVNFH
jgi:DNA-directed RNA polymerase subunit RPC12/RpoP